MARASGFEAVYRDYKDKGVQLYFVYKRLAHPEYNRGFVQSYSLEERLKQIKMAREVLLTTIPWLADDMSNAFSRRLGGGNNIELILDKKGKLVNMRDWGNPRLLRDWLEKNVGPVDNKTTVESLGLPRYSPPAIAKKGLVPRVVVKHPMTPVSVKPLESNQPFYAKLRLEVEDKVLGGEKGEMYVGFHLDPVYDTHWNNLAPPLTWKMYDIKQARLKPAKATFRKVEVKSDVDPREFLGKIEFLGQNPTSKLDVTYYGCDNANTWCKKITQTYDVTFEKDMDAGRVFRRGTKSELEKRSTPPKFNPKKFWENDKNKDGVVELSETNGVSRILLNILDLNYDGKVSRKETESYKKRPRPYRK